MTDQNTTIFPDRITNYAGFWVRFLAVVLDGFIIGAVIVGLRYATGGSLLEPTLLGNISGIVVGWLYAALLESSVHQATLGKRALNIRVTNLQGGRPSFGQATGRHFGKWISFLILLIGYLMMLWDDKKQTLHDKMAGTLVITNSNQ